MNNEYTAIITANRRDVTKMNPKILLLNILDNRNNLVRDHMWVDETYFKSIAPKNNKVTYTVVFTANKKDYIKSFTFCDIENIKVIKRYRVKKSN